MQNIFDFIKKYWIVFIVSILILTTTAFIEFETGRSIFGPSGTFGWWEGSVWSSENSQRVADAYTFSHIIHGMLFYAFLWWLFPRVPVKYRFLMALLLEAGWELLENSPIIIDRYRSVTIAQGYIGDSILNSVSDIVMVGIGFIATRFSKIWVTIFLIIAMEIGCLFWVRDNLTLNVIMLAYPVEFIKDWQSTGR